SSISMRPPRLKAIMATVRPRSCRRAFMPITSSVQPWAWRARWSTAATARSISTRRVSRQQSARPLRRPQVFYPFRSQAMKSAISPLEQLHALWRASNYLGAAMIYLRDNPLLREPLKIEHIKQRLLGHWGSSPGLSFCYLHLARLVREQDLNAIFITGPGHGAPGVLAPVWLEDTYGEVYPDKCARKAGIEGLRRFLRDFSFPGGIGSHCTPELPGSIHEGGELGYSLSHAFGAAFDNPDLIVAAVVGDGEAETGPLATSWHG